LAALVPPAGTIASKYGKYVRITRPSKVEGAILSLAFQEPP